MMESDNRKVNNIAESQEQIRELVDMEIEKVVPRKFSKWFGSIQYRPTKVRFATQNPDERVYLVIRMHWIRNLGWILNHIFYSTLPFILLTVLNLLNINLSFLSFQNYTIILLVFYSIILTSVIRNFFDWYFDVYIVTNERVLDYEFKPFVGYVLTEAPLDSIQDVEEKSLGFLADIFDYGSIKVRTASTAGELAFDYIADPVQVRDTISDLAKIIKRYQNAD